MVVAVHGSGRLVGGLPGARPADMMRGMALFKRTWLWWPTWRGGLALLVLALVPTALVWLGAGFILSPTCPRIDADVLVVEGWLPDYALAEALREFQNGRYELLVTTGGPLETGSYLVAYTNFAAVAAATLVRLGADPGRVVAVAAPAVKSDRTRASARALRGWLAEQRPQTTSLNLVSLGPHTRRSWHLFARVLAPGCRVGAISVAPNDAEMDAWWTTSAGFRAVTSEAVALLYAWLRGAG
jgi:hypothetical protein